VSSHSKSVARAHPRSLEVPPSKICRFHAFELILIVGCFEFGDERPPFFSQAIDRSGASPYRTSAVVDRSASLSADEAPSPNTAISPPCKPTAAELLLACPAACPEPPAPCSEVPEGPDCPSDCWPAPVVGTSSSLKVSATPVRSTKSRSASVRTRATPAVELGGGSR
jgi:hypothetical protein